MAQQTARSRAPANQEGMKSPGCWNREAPVRRRDYTPTHGRFIERDPIGFEAGDTNWYRFVANGPTAKTDPSGLQQPPIPDAPKGIRYAANKPGNTVIADGKGGVEIQIDPRQGQGSKHKDRIRQITEEHEQIHIDDLRTINKTPGTDVHGKPVPRGTQIQFASRRDLGKSEVRATDDSLKKLRALRKTEKDANECKWLDDYIKLLEEYRKKNLVISKQ